MEVPLRHVNPGLVSRAICFAVGLWLLPIHPGISQVPEGVVFSTYLSGDGIEASQAIAFDEDGNVYVAGMTSSADFPTINALHGYRGGILGLDAYVARFSPNGALSFSTFLGGSGDDFATSMAVDLQGRAYISGGTASADFPATAGALQSFRSGSFMETDGFLVILSADGTAIEYATHLGGTGDDLITAIAVGAAGEIYLAGTTTSDDFPTTAGAFQTERSEGSEHRSTGFAVKLRPETGAGYVLDYATYLGGSGEDMPSAIAVDAEGAAWIAGFTNSRDFPVQNPIKADFAGPLRQGEGDAFVARLNASGSALEFSTYLGGSQDDQATGIAVDPFRNVYVTGWTASNDFPATPGTYQSERRGLRDRFVVKLSPSGTAWSPEYATLFGSPGFEMGRAGLAVDENGRVWIAGATTSDGLPGPGSSFYRGGETDGFVALMDASGTALQYAAFLGGSGADVITALALRGNTLCVAGNTGSVDFPVHDAVQAAFAGPPAAGPQMTGTFVACMDLLRAIDTEAAPELPLDFALHPNYPNPFNPQTTIRFDVKTPSHVTLTVYDLLGRRQMILVSEAFSAGRHEVSFDGRRLASGVYFYVIEMGDFRAVRKMLLLR